MNKTGTNFISFENLIKLIEEHKKETHPHKNYEFDSISYTMLLMDISNLIDENNQLKLINQEHQQINGELRQANKLLNEQYIRLYKEYEQQERIKYLERSNNRREDTILEQRQKICDLEDNWNKLKEFVAKEGIEINTKEYGTLEVIEKNVTFETMQELEQGSNGNE